MVGALLVTLLCILVHAWQDNVHDCNDGRRYTSGRSQPYPFHRRWCGWPVRLLQLSTYAAMLALGLLMRDWKHALLLGTLPGFWFIATHPTTVDAPAMLVAFVAALLFPTQPYAAVGLSCLSGFIHERGPVFAAIAAWHPILLLGLVACGWWRRPAKADADVLVGQGLVHAIVAHRPYVDWLDMRTNLLTLRGVWFAAAYLGCSASSLAALAVAMLSRVVGTDGGRYLFWAAPLVIRELPDVPTWFVFAHVATFRRLI